MHLADSTLLNAESKNPLGMILHIFANLPFGYFSKAPRSWADVSVCFSCSYVKNSPAGEGWGGVDHLPLNVRPRALRDLGHG